MKRNKLSTGIEEYWKFEKPGDSIVGRFIGITQGKLTPVVMLKTSGGVIGVNVSKTLETIANQLVKNKVYVFTFSGYGKSKNGDYYIFDVWEPMPETAADKEQLKSWADQVTFTVEVEEAAEPEKTEPAETTTQAEEDSDDDLPF